MGVTPFPLVSICMPAYNAGKYIKEALESLLSQSYQNLEIVVVDDGSTDNTWEVLKKYKQRGIKVIHQTNQGQSAAANAAFRASSGDLIKFMDADDLLSPDFIKNQCQVLASKENYLASASWGRFYNDDVSTFNLNKESVWRDMAPMDWIVESINDGASMMQCALWLIPRVLLSTSGLWNERLSLINDFDFFIRVILASKGIAYAPNSILYYRSNVVGSLSAQKTRKAYQSAYLSSQLGVETILAYEDSERTRRVCADVFQNWKFQFYPVYKDLFSMSEEYISRLGGSNQAFPAGGKTKFLSRIIGWKLTRQLLQHIQ